MKAVLIAAVDEPGMLWIAGAVRLHCDRCHRPVQVAPSGQTRLREEDMELVCIPCGADDVMTNGIDSVADITPEQIQELLSAKWRTS